MSQRISKTADVIIVGGGVTGLSVALHLRELGVRKIILLERHHVGAGQSGHAAGIVRALVGHRAVASMLMESLRFFDNFRDRYGEDVRANRVGFLLLSQPEHADFLGHVIQQANEAGCDARRISEAEAVKLQPGLRSGAGDLYTFEPSAIYVDPMLVTQVYAKTARRLGVEVVESCEVRSILKDGSWVRGVETMQGAIESRTVVIGTAIWGAPQLAKVGIEVPVYPHRTESVYYSVWPQSPSRLVRIVSDARAMLYLRPEGTNQMFVGWREGDRTKGIQDFKSADPDNYWQTAYPDSLSDMSRRLALTLPFMSEGFAHRSYACVYDYTPDGMPILDHAESVKGLFFSLGYSGGGFSLAPWVGSVMSQFIVNGIKSPEMELLRLSRFGEGQLLSWGNVKRAS